MEGEAERGVDWAHLPMIATAARLLCRGSSAGRAPDWKSGCLQFDSGPRHQEQEATAAMSSPLRVGSRNPGEG